MIRRFFIIFCFVCFAACDDGDIITVDLDFDKNLELCSNNTESFLIYDTRENPNESLSLIIPRNNNEEFPYTEPTPIGTPTTLNLNGTTRRFIYRTYNRAIETGELCNPIPPANLNIVEDYEANSGTVDVYVSIADDDNDGIPSDLEGRGLADVNGDFPNAQDTDSDGIPDYLDQDDDNDNVITNLEIDNADGDNDPTTNPLDTDGNGTPDHLDNDDDGDGILTRLEDLTGEKDPRNSDNFVVDETGIDRYRYLYNHPDAMEAFADFGFIETNEYTRTVIVNFLVNDINLEILSTEQIDLGTLSYQFTLPQDN